MLINDADFGHRLSDFDDILFLCHRNADPDAIGSGYALQQAFHGRLGVVGTISKAAKNLANAIGAKPEIDPVVHEHELVVVVDTSAWIQLEGMMLTSYAVVDHHQDMEILDDAMFYVHRIVDSTSEIVFRILQKNNGVLSRDACLGLLVGIISDTGRFKHCSAGSFKTMEEILEVSKIEYVEALDILSRVPLDVSERIAILKAAKRACIEWVDDWIVVSSEVNAFESSSAMSLLELGADVSFVGGRHKGKFRVSGRARFEATRNGLDLASIMRDVARTYNGDGGGHKGAAALEVPWPCKDILGVLRRRAMNVLENT